MVECLSWWSCRIVEVLNRRMVKRYDGVVELSNRRIVAWWSWWSCRRVELSSDRMVKLVKLSSHRLINGVMVDLVKLSSRRIVESWNRGVSGVIELSNRRLVKSSNAGMVERYNSGVFELPNCR